MLDQIKKKLEGIDLKWKIGGLVGLAAVAGLLYFKLAPPKQTPKTGPTVPPAQSLRERQDADAESPEKSLIRVINRVKKVQGEEGRMGFETIKAIYLGHYELARKSYIQLTLRHRSDRRKVVGNLDRYREMSKEYEESIEELRNRHLNAILAHFHIDKEGWMEIIEELSASSKEDWENLLNEAENDELAHLRSKDKPKVGRDILVSIYRFKTKILNEHGNTYKALPNIDTADLCSLVEKILQDKVFEQFKVEEEDIKYSEKQLTEGETDDLERFEEEYLDVFRGLILQVDDEEDLASRSRSRSHPASASHNHRDDDDV